MLNMLPMQPDRTVAVLTSELGRLIANRVGDVRDNPFPHLLAITQKELLHFAGINLLRLFHWLSFLDRLCRFCLKIEVAYFSPTISF